MATTTIGIVLAKLVFSTCIVDARGHALARKDLRRDARHFSTECWHPGNLFKPDSAVRHASARTDNFASRGYSQRLTQRNCRGLSLGEVFHRCWTCVLFVEQQRRLRSKVIDIGAKPGPDFEFDRMRGKRDRTANGTIKLTMRLNSRSERAGAHAI